MARCGSCLLFALAVVLLACKPASTSVPDTPNANTTTDAGNAVVAPAADPKPAEAASAPARAATKAFRLGNLLPDFKPPTLAELDAMAEWVDQPVLDSLELRREKQAKEKSPASDEEAAKLRNDSPEANAKIIDTLGRLPDSDGQVDYDGVFTRWLGADIKSSNPILADSRYEFDVNEVTSYGLFSFDWNMRPFAMKEYVKSWQSSRDHMYDKIVMRDDVTWSDGKPITAHDVVFSLKLIMSEAVPVPAVRSQTDQIKWIEAVDDYTLLVFHKESLATNVWNVNFPVVPKHIYEKSVADDPTLVNSDYHVRMENEPVFGGPYKITRRIRGQEVVTTRRDDWYQHNGKQVRSKPYFKEIRFRVIQEPSSALLAVKAADLHDLELTPELWRTQTNDDDFYRHNTKIYGVQWQYTWFGWNLKTPFFSDRRVRQAMSFAFDHKEMIEKLRYGMDEPCTGIFYPTSPWGPKTPTKPYQQNLDRAEQLLDEAGWEDTDDDGVRDRQIDGKKVKFEFTMIVGPRQDRIDLCNLLRQNLEQIGVVCNIRPTEFTVMQEKIINHDYHAVCAAWSTGADPDTAENLWGTGQQRNHGSYSNAEVDRLFREGRKEFDYEKRREIYGQIHTLIYEDQPYTFLFFGTSMHAFNRGLRGYMISPRGPYHYGPGIFSIWRPAIK